MTKRIPISVDMHTGEMIYAIVDDDDYDRLVRYSWQPQIKSGTGRLDAVRRSTQINKVKVNVLMHHDVMGKPPKGFQIDHIDRNPLNNTRKNLRIVTPYENSKNSSRYNGGVVKMHRQWAVTLLFPTKELALAAKEKHRAIYQPEPYKRRY